MSFYKSHFIGTYKISDRDRISMNSMKNLLCGIELYYYDEGTPCHVFKMYFFNNFRHGVLVGYVADVPTFVLFYRDNIKNGPKIIFTQSGKLESMEFFDKGTLIAVKIF
jgi:antitoxin component YwqK of YwqJK toxin-antitoxin module